MQCLVFIKLTFSTEIYATKGMPLRTFACSLQLHITSVVWLRLFSRGTNLFLILIWVYSALFFSLKVLTLSCFRYVVFVPSGRFKSSKCFCCWWTFKCIYTYRSTCLVKCDTKFLDISDIFYFILLMPCISYRLFALIYHLRVLYAFKCQSSLKSCL